MDQLLLPQELRLLENNSLIGDLHSSTAPEFISTWSVVILAAVSVATLFTKLQLPRLRRRKTLIRLPSFYSSFEDDDNEETSISSSDSEEEKEDEIEESDEEQEESDGFRGGKMNEMGNFSFSSFSLSDLVGGMGVVKAWDGLGLGFDRSRGYPVVELGSPAEIVSAVEEAGGPVVRVWDARTGDETPAATVWPLLRRRITGVVAREGKVYVGDEGGQVAALDFRNLAQVEVGDGSGYWWRSAARCLTLLSPRLENA